MQPTLRAPTGPRGAIGAAAETAAAAALRRRGWVVLGRNLHVGRDEIDILAREPGPPAVLVVVEVRARSSSGFGSPLESVDDRKVARLYRAAWALRRRGHPMVAAADLALLRWRVDLLTLRRSGAGEWLVEQHLRGLRPR
jgi:Holliday junction resolvase-like predicted endonuclease